jgi:hypothetical protein
VNADDAVRPPCESALEGRVVFVLGPPRSGTTWLQELLLAHPALGGIQYESLVFVGLGDVWHNAHRSEADGISAYLSPEEIAAAQRVYCDSLFAATLRKHSPEATWFVEKSPPHSVWVPAMAVVYPDAWYINIVRDGRDMVRSLLAAPFGTWDADLAAKIWVSYVRAVRSDSWRLPRFQEIRYENLLRDPAGETKRLFRWMGLEVDEGVTEALEVKAGQEVVRFGSTDPVGSGKWKSMSPEELAAVDRVAHDLLAELGYLGP